MKGSLSKVAILLGLILITLTFLWRFLIVERLMLFPQGFQFSSESQSEIVWYIDPATSSPLPPGAENRSLIQVTKELRSIDDQYDSMIALVEERTIYRGFPTGEAMSISVYALDRHSMRNVTDERAYDWDPSNPVDRSGSYYPAFPRDPSKNRGYPLWKSEIGEPVEMVYLNDQEEEGTRLACFRWKINPDEKKKVDPNMLRGFGIAKEVSWAQLKTSLLSMGIDLDAIIGEALGLLDQEERTQLVQLLEKPLPVNFYWSGISETLVESKLGIPIKFQNNTETLSMELDPTPLLDLVGILMRHSSNPLIGKGIAGMMELGSTFKGQIKIFDLHINTSEESAREAMDWAKKLLPKVDLARIYIPWILILTGIALSFAGIIFARKASRMPLN